MTDIEKMKQSDNHLKKLMNDLDEIYEMQEYANKNGVSSDVIESLNRRQKDLMSQINKSLDMISEQNNNIHQKDKELEDRIERSRRQLKEIEYKKKLIATRDRMLELSKEKNVYKLKVIYSLVAVMILIVVVLLAGYVFFVN